MNDKLISVIVTTCNRKKEILKRALDSVVSQTYHPLEILLIIDQPLTAEDISSFVSHNYGDMVKIFSNPKQKGACYSRNRGIELAVGEYIAFLDDDDEWLPEKLEKQCQKMRPGINLVYSDYRVKSDHIDIKPAVNREYPVGNILEELLAFDFIGGCSVPLLRADTLREFGGFDLAFHSCQDYDVWMQMAIRGNVACVREVLSYYYVMDDSITSGFERRIQGWENMLAKYADCYASFPKSKAKFFGVMIEEGMKRGYYSFSGKKLIQSFEVFPYNVMCMWAVLRGLAERVLGIY